MKYLYSVCFLISSIIGANAQYVDSIWKVNHETQNIYSIPLFDSFFIHDTKPYLSQSEEEAYTYTWQEDSILEIIYTKPADNSLWPSLQFNTVRWEGDTSNRFMYNTNGNPVNHSTAYGYHVDMSKETQRMVQFEIQ